MLRKLRFSSSADCPCCSGLPYGECCGPFHDGLATGIAAPTPQALMRSRYCAYALGLLEYLLATWHASSAPGDLALAPIKWTGLELRHFETAGDVGVVEFVARYKVNGKAEHMHELSRFVREPSGEAGRWYYIDGEAPSGEA